MEEKRQAIVLKSVDFQENDKLLWLYTLEEGRITAIAKGVKKAGAKLKYASQPFCFGEFMLTNSKGRNILTGCSQVESFYELRSNINCYYAGCIMLDTVSTLVQENQPNSPLFLSLLKHLQQLLSGDIDNDTLIIKFLLTFLQLEGYGLSFDKCNICQNTSFTKLYLDYSAGGVVCVNCRSNSATVLAPITQSTLDIIQKMDLDHISRVKIKQEYLTASLVALNEYFTYSLVKIKSLVQYVQILQSAR
ncbi:MAG: DNA repair protein RecO [Clostridia bacterium]|nr:DNA repair protein RecO [Clostridia bacterium]